MESYQLPDFNLQKQEFANELRLLHQNNLLDEGEFINFSRDRGIEVWGCVTGDPGNFHKRGWLPSDGHDYLGNPTFHPFRIYSFHRILTACKLNISAASSLYRDKIQGLVEYVLKDLPTLDQIEQDAIQRNRVIDLAILLEPIYWPRITGLISNSTPLGDEQFRELLDQYRIKVLDIVKTLDPDSWKQVHEYLLRDAARMDKNDELYLFLRLSKWEKRKEIQGHISGSLWLRHIAEVIRRAFEESHSAQWHEEDITSGTWSEGDRTFAFGSERPLDDEPVARPYLAWGFGLLTGSAVRWYVEGETEYYAILQVLAQPARYCIEIVNLRGILVADKDNVAIKLNDWLQEDIAQRRFSMISFDDDVGQNVKTIRRQVEQKKIVGHVAVHKPDFEFSNFAISELVEIAARIDEEYGTPGDAVRQADWTGISKGGDFADRYRKVSARRPQGLKGEVWGRALAVYAREYLNRNDNGSSRPFWHEITTALRCKFANYDFHRETIVLDPNTFQQIDRRSKVAGTEGSDK